MSLELIVETYGYSALLVGTFLEGETILIIGGFLAHRGYLSLSLVILAAFLGTLAGDQLFFFIGRMKGEAFLEKRPSWKPNIKKAHDLLERYQVLLILGFRFLYGMRTVTPFVIGMSRVKTGTFFFLNFLGALVWAILIGSAGYFFGTAFEAILGNIKHIEVELMIVIGFIGFAAWVAHFYRNKPRKTTDITAQH